jgi:P-type Ca2+ transporter type 2B
MLWVNLIMDTLASLALATEPPAKDLLKRKPYGRNRPLISREMLRNIIFHGIYQLVVIFFILFVGPGMFDIESGISSVNNSKPSQHFTMIFNSFVLMTLFNELNARKLYDQQTTLSTIFLFNPIFICIWLFSFILQFLVISFGSYAFSCHPLTLEQWAWCFLFGIGTLIWGQFVTIIKV